MQRKGPVGRGEDKDRPQYGRCFTLYGTQGIERISRMAYFVFGEGAIKARTRATEGLLSRHITTRTRARLRQHTYHTLIRI